MTILVFLMLPYNALALSTAPNVSMFVDVGSNHPYAYAISWMQYNGVIEGYNIIGESYYKEFKPEQCVNRAEFLKMLFLTNETSLNEANYGNPFPDVPDTAWYRQYVTYAKFMGVLDGYPDGYFRPGNCVNRVEAMKMAANLMVLDKIRTQVTPLYYDDKFIIDMSGSAWYAKYARTLFEMRAVGTSHTYFADNTSVNAPIINFTPEGSMTRAEVAEMLYRIKALVDNNRTVYSDYLEPNNLGDDIACTLQYVPGLVLNVIDEDGDPFTGARVEAYSSDDKLVSTFTDGNKDGTYSGLYETSGYYRYIIKHEDYVWHHGSVFLEKDECHVITQTFDTELERLEPLL